MTDYRGGQYAAVDEDDGAKRTTTEGDRCDCGCHDDDGGQRRPTSVGRNHTGMRERPAGTPPPPPAVRRDAESGRRGRSSSRGEPRTRGPTTGRPRSATDAVRERDRGGIPSQDHRNRRRRDADGGELCRTTGNAARAAADDRKSATTPRPSNAGHSHTASRHVTYSAAPQACDPNVGDHDTAASKHVKSPSRPRPALPPGAGWMNYSDHEIRDVDEIADRMRRRAAADPRSVDELRAELANLETVMWNKKGILNVIRYRLENHSLPVERRTTIQEWADRNRAAIDELFNGWAAEHRAELERRRAHDRAEAERRDAYDETMARRWAAMEKVDKERRRYGTYC